MTSLVAILALALSSRPPLGVTVSAERVALPGAEVLALEARPFERRLSLRVAAGRAPALARALRGASLACPDVDAAGDRVVLRCRTARLRATLVPAPGGGRALELHVLTVLPWRPDEEGPPLVPFELATLRMGDGPEAAAERALAEGRLDEARARYLEVARAGFSPLAELRLGDLALRADAPEEAIAHWRLARAEAPWGRLAAARLCELDARCLHSDQLEAVFDWVPVALPLRADLVLRRARLLAFDGAVVEAARLLVAEARPGGACAPALPWCRHLLAIALGLPAPDGAEALGVYLDTPGHGEGPLALELARLAALQAEGAGAPGFAATLLAAATGKVPADALPEHLLRVARLYLAAGDRPRADEIARFAATRLTAAQLAAPGWAAVRRAVAAEPPPPTAGPPPAAQDPDLAAAAAALSAARLAVPPSGARP